MHGVLFVMHYEGRDRVVREGLASAAALKDVMRPTFPIELMANARAMALVPAARLTSLFDHRREMELDPRLRKLVQSHINSTFAAAPDASAYLFKLSCLLQTRWRRTVFFDCDVLVLQRTLVNDLLHKALDVADVAMPLDPGRAAHLVPGSVGAAPWVAPAVGPPMLCSAVLAYRSGVSTNAFLLGAARRLIRSEHPGVRQGDQEMMWFEWTRRSRELRVRALPEETCTRSVLEARPRHTLQSAPAH